ncbi:hypothetical protein MAR_035227 [Mya arenaria]|uniref:Short-chain collagen C4 n=1 Tax=Mya arenaria TaxID=6604 RepID=A0ABY7ESH3_MYAAR|nr:short-chain collagen C4-like [Mya arenaria]WAR10151.1 hypothetical protein MAR_035227 [Mya arenaria]
MEGIFAKFLLIVYAILVSSAGSDVVKRVLLHTDVDVVNELNRLTSEVASLTQSLSSLTQRLDMQDHEIAALKSTASSSIYTRWGRTTCPGNGSSLVYKGYMAGTSLDDHSAHGEGSNYFCLSDTPIWDHYSEGVDNGIFLSGVEYAFHPHFQSSSLSQFFGSNIVQGEAPCAICKVIRETSVMIPGRKDCYPGWTKEYSGYLVGGYPGYGDSSELVCLDRRPEILLDDGKFQGENLLYFVEAHCNGGLTCPPYVNGREISCVVCSN